uniref:Two pore calcium channel protein 1-like n=1 Tax=Saccoglossus kowalevskii TaxID=10224 RepID=A0ABM0LZK8_SACKO|nr:PREDICTED: two pore calcium channel protein 1-like [Saccoglossus kowalevskii]
MAEREDIGSPLLEQTLTSDDSTRSLINVRRYVQQTSTEQRKVWELNYREAAIYLQEGQNNEKFRTHPKNQNAVPAYLIVHNVWYNILDLAVSLLLLMLALCEHPAVKPFRLDEIVHGSLELFALTIIGLQLGMKMRWLGLKIFVTHKRTAIKSLTLIVMYAEAIVVLIRQTNHFRVTRALRPIFLIDTHYCGGVRRVMRQIFQSLPPILDMLVLLLFIMLLFAILAFYLFQADSINYQFDNFEESFVNLFVLLTTANFPDVMMPAYHKNRFYSLFFIIYLVLELYFLMNLLLAVVYETFTGIEKEKFRQLLLHKYKGASCAFKLLCSTKNPGKVTFLHFSGLMKYFKPRHKKRDVYLSFKALNVNETGLLTLGEFCNIYEITSLKWSHYKGNTHWFDSLPFVLNMIMRGIHKLVVSALFNYFIYIVIAANGIWFLVDTVTLSNQRAKFEFHEEFALTWYSIMFVSIYVVETILKILALGPKEYFNYGWNM